MKFDPGFHQILQVYMYENVTSGPSQNLNNKIGKYDLPNITMKTPPTIGSGIVTNKAPNLPNIPRIMMINPPT